MSNPVLIVCGSRSYPNQYDLNVTLQRLWSEGSFTALWSTDAAGASRLARLWAMARCIPVRRWPADWARYGRAAGVRRSAEMIAAAPPGSLLVAFVPGRLADSVGTAHEVRLARQRGLAVVIVDSRGPRVLAADPVLL